MRKASRAKSMAAFEAGEADVVTIFYNRFQSVISQIPTMQQVIPAKFEATGATALYDYEPSEEAILADLLPRGVATQIFTALLENGASEQGARMSAMDNATRNAGDMINQVLTIQYNRSPSGRDHQRAYRNHFGRRGALTNPE
jgi:F-type H+-transporting ATPase subunit gamma